MRLLAGGRRQILALRFPGDLLTPDAREPVVPLTRVCVADALAFMTCLTNGAAEYQALRRVWLAAGRSEVAALRDKVALERMASWKCISAGLTFGSLLRRSSVGPITSLTFPESARDEVLNLL